jgi:hypothetical protein
MVATARTNAAIPPLRNLLFTPGAEVSGLRHRFSLDEMEMPPRWAAGAFVMRDERCCASMLALKRAATTRRRSGLRKQLMLIDRRRFLIGMGSAVSLGATVAAAPLPFPAYAALGPGFDIIAIRGQSNEANKGSDLSLM